MSLACSPVVGTIGDSGQLAWIQAERMRGRFKNHARACRDAGFGESEDQRFEVEDCRRRRKEVEGCGEASCRYPLVYLPPPLMQVTPSRRFALEQSPPLSCKETW